MTLQRLILAGLRHDARTHVGVALGAALTCAVITGALVVGDSVRHTLRQTALQRLGNVTHIIQSGDRLFEADLAQRLAPDTGGDVAGVLIVEGVVGRPGGNRAGQVQVVGIDDRTLPLLNLPAAPEPGHALINTTLARRLGVGPGGTAIVRLADPRAIQAGLPIGEDQPGLALRVQIDGIVGNGEGGRFTLRAEQAPPLNLFVSRDWLADALGISGKANLLIASGFPGGATPMREFDPRKTIPLSLADAELDMQRLEGGEVSLDTPRVLIDAATTEALDPLADQRVLTYLANTIARGDRQTPYSMVAATDRAIDGLADGKIVINRWLADDLGAAAGDTVTLTYYLPDEGARLVEAAADFEVAKVVPIEGPFAVRGLTPPFPGMDQAERMVDWDGGPGIDRSRIRPKDEAYWDQHRATPKAFVTLADGQRLWANRYGDLTSMWFPAGTTRTALAQRLDPIALGFGPRDVRAAAMQASKATVDFGGLFLGLSMFVIIAAGLLTAMLFGFGVEKRARQVGTLLALGWTRRKVRGWLLGEATLIAAAGVVLGAPLGLGYAWLLTDALSGRWSGAVADTAVTFHANPASVVIGTAAALLLAALASAWALRGTTRQPARRLLAGLAGPVSEPSRPRAITALCGAAAAVLGAVALTLTAPAGSGPATAGAFFGSGALLLIAGLLLNAAALARPRGDAHVLRLRRLTSCNLARRRGRSLAAVAFIAAGVFIVASVVGFAPGLPADPTQRHTGTGGFALVGQTTLPITVDLNTPAGRDRFGLEEDELPTGSVVPFMVSAGDDASCLNLNKTPRPRVLGVDPQLLQQRHAFTLNTSNGWLALDDTLDDGAIPAIADANTAQWALHLPVGGAIDITDAAGRPLRLRLVGTAANSILQGNLIISEAHFRRHFPDIAGDRMFLIDAPPGAVAERQAALSRQLEDVGLSLQSARDRLASFNTVQATYLSIFQALGALGVTLGCVGLSIIVLRNVLERRPELAMLAAAGFDRPRIRRLLLTEHLRLLALGLVIALIASAIALVPAWRDASVSAWGIALPVMLTAGACVVVAGLAVLLAVRSALAGPLVAALRDE